ncbi:ubiquinol-cytochrome c reductase iron-sulfur subunit [Mucilaginibacter calamicampi]|uniref:Ubiquinol-cytochrome c reductase iron-sulfur subunit n=1 Tax=Mucilaginibacter calamicampi TaxID=1302352 RepID=A0ABW2YYL3_9SPHI
MKRDEFIASLTLAGGALCMGCLLACSKKNEPEPEDANILLKIDLSSNLIDLGQSKIEKGVIVVRAGSGSEAYSFRAAEAACVFSGDSIQFNRQTNRFSCPAHGSIFDLEGRVLSGSAKANLKMYTIKISDNILLVYGPGTIEPLSEPVNFNVDLTAELKNVGEFKRVKDVIVLRTGTAAAADSFVALSSVCTHQGSTIDYKPLQNQFVCPTHGSTYSLSGEVVKGPAPLALKKYKVTLSLNTLNISEA